MSLQRLIPAKCCDYCFSINRKDEDGFTSVQHSMWFCGMMCYYLHLMSIGQVDKTNTVLYNELMRVKEKHYPFDVIRKNKEKMEQHAGRTYKFIRTNNSSLGTYDATDNLSVD